MNTLITGLISFTAGSLFGYFIRGFIIDRTPENKLELNHWVLLVVSSIWLLSMLVDIASPTYETSPLVHTLMGAIVGFFYKPMKIGGE